MVQAVARKRALILVAEPGSGKTTQVPWALAQSGDAGQVLVLEPRRLAARMAAQFVARSHGLTLGREVGFRVRHEDATCEATRLVYMTQGLLWRIMASDPALRGVGTVVFDEFHDRSLAQDLILGALLQRRAQGGPGPAVVIMSATLAYEAVQPLLPEAEVMHLPGRQHPVTVDYLRHENRDRLDVQVARGVAQVLGTESPATARVGHILAFLPGQKDINRAAQACQALANTHQLKIAPLHASLPIAQQDAAVAPSQGRRLILATNVAETSLTIDGVTSVVDTGLANLAQVDALTGITRLRTGLISQAAAVQRAGRAGRTGPGHCLRLYTAVNFKRRNAFEPPDILRTDLAEAVLWLDVLGLPPLTHLPLIDRPTEAAIAQAEATLARLGAWQHGRSTSLGRQLLHLGMHPRLGRVALGAHTRGIGPLGCRTAAALASSSMGPRSGQAQQGNAHAVGPSDLEPLLLPEAQDPEARQVASSLHKALLRHVKLEGAAPVAAPPHLASQLLEEALLEGFSDRLTRRQPPLGPRAGELPLVLGWGGRGVLSVRSCVRDSPLMLALQATSRGDHLQGVVVDVAHGVAAENLLALDDGRLQETVEVAVNAQHGRIEKLEIWRYDGLTVHEARATSVSPEEAQAALSAWINSHGASLVQAIGSEPTYERLEARLQAAGASQSLGPLVAPAFSSGPAPETAAAQTELQQAALATLRHAAAGCRSVQELQALPIVRLVQDALAPPWQEALRKYAPTHVTLRSGARLEVHYRPGQEPYVATYLQAFFGSTEGPRVGSAQQPLTLHLWGPNRQALQVTRDLRNFWQAHYPKLRGALARRYPRHAWPEDPVAAAPSLPRPRRFT